MKTKHFVFRGNQRRRPTRETTKLRNLKQNRLSMVAVVTLPPVEMRLQKKWKRRWAVESGLCAYIYFFFFPLCSGMVLCMVSSVADILYCLLVFRGFPQDGEYSQAACCTEVSDTE